MKLTVSCLLTECDGTGEPNIEEQVREHGTFLLVLFILFIWTCVYITRLSILKQFMEWVDEGAKCPYCNGVGFEICDVCHGKTVT